MLYMFFESIVHLNEVLYAPINDLLHTAVLAEQNTQPESAWKKLPCNTPTYQPTATVLAGYRLATGGLRYHPSSV